MEEALDARRLTLSTTPRNSNLPQLALHSLWPWYSLTSSAFPVWAHLSPPPHTLLLLLLLQTPLQTQCNLLSFSSPDPMPPECFSGTPSIMHPNTTNPLHGKKCLIKAKCIHNRRTQQNKNKNKCFFPKEGSATILQQIPFFLCVRQDFFVCIVQAGFKFTDVGLPY